MTSACSIIEVHLRELSQLFDAFDPSPFREKELNGDAEEYIVESVKELPSGAPCALLIHLDQPTGLFEDRAVGNAIRVHFARRSRLLHRDLHRLLRRGLISLGIGVAFLALCFIIAQLVARLMGESSLATLSREGLVIVGWVAMWRPLEIFLYDWWPIVGKCRLYDRLSDISVRIVHEGAVSTDTSSPTVQKSMEAGRALARWEGEGGRVLPLAAGLDDEPASPTTDNDNSGLQNIYVVFTLTIQAVLALGLILFAVRRDWENVFLTITVIGLTVVPAFVLRRYRVYVPPEFQLIAVAFVFLSLFLGSAQDFYHHFWWWDMVLHAGSGFLLGIVGWIVLFLLNETDHLPHAIRPKLLCFFGVTFAVFVGVLWEIFEFAVDSIWPHVNMMHNETGVADTMHDLIVDTLGAILVALMGWAYFKSKRYSFLVDAVRSFIRKNPGLFRKTGAGSN